VVDKLEADHARVSDLLVEVEAAAQALSRQGERTVRPRLVDALQNLAVAVLGGDRDGHGCCAHR
jgi:hypothetical protein